MKDKQKFYGHGKLLLSGEYFVMDGAKALAIPTSYGQSLQVEYKKSYQPTLHWKSYDYNDNLWFDSKFEFWHFNCLDEKSTPEITDLQRILRQVRKQNSHFLRDEMDVLVTTRLDFPRNWGLGSSSSLIYNISQWAYISPFELLFSTYGGSGYDIACAQSYGPILYEKKNQGPSWSIIQFDPPFKENIYFIFLGKKTNTKQAINIYKEKLTYTPKLTDAVSKISQDMIRAKNIEEFDQLIQSHEKLISESLDLVPAKIQYFRDFWGEIKSLGAWGGDFIMATSKKKISETRLYFADKGFTDFISYRDMIYSPPERPSELQA
ncbi:MAG: GYDIA family GHMP kinase [Halobacteriovoraceae bacterium]|nr:GYDIA family GHMP kinase [Halobacteriovoraceae bacterium]